MALDQYSEQFQHRLQEKQAESVRKREAEESRAKKKFDAELAEAAKPRESAMKKADEAHTWLQREIEERYATNRQQADREWKPLIERLELRWYVQRRRFGAAMSVRWARPARRPTTGPGLILKSAVAGAGPDSSFPGPNGRSRPAGPDGLERPRPGAMAADKSFSVRHPLRADRNRDEAPL
jgi:hypothetical protein